MTRVLPIAINVFLLLIPWQIVWIYHEPMMNDVKWQYGTLGFYATELLAWGIVGMFLFQYVKKTQEHFFLTDRVFGKDRLLVISYLLLIIYFFASALWAPVADVARQQALRITLTFLLFIVLLSIRVDVKKWFIYGSILPSMLGVWQFLSQSTFSATFLGLVEHRPEDMGTAILAFGDERWLRAYGTFSHPNVFGGYLICVLFFIFLFWLEQKKTDKKKIEEYVVLGTALITVSALFMTFSRSSWLAFVILFLGMGIICVKKKIGLRFHVMLFVPMIIFIFLFWPLVSVRLGFGSVQEYLTIAERVSLIVGAKEMIATHPWFGVGAGNYTAAMYLMDSTQPGWLYQPVHNVPLLLFAEIGVIGLLLCIMVIGSFTLCFQRELLARWSWIMVTGAMILPLLLLDHYFYSSYIGLMLAVFFASQIVRRG